MHLKEIKISNILSFPYLANFEESEAISFFNNWGYEGLRILIWNNASGKSNFVSIIEEFFSTLIFDYSYSKEYIINNNISSRKAISALKTQTKNIHNNYTSSDLPAQIEILIELGGNDYENIGFVCKFHAKINEILNKYSKLDIRFPEYKLSTLMEQSSNLKIRATFNEKEQKFHIEKERLNEHQLFLLQCIQYQKLLQIIITIFNEFERKPNERKRYFLKKTFAILNIKRDYLEFHNFINPHELINDINYTKNSLIGYTTCMNNIRSILENFSQTQILSQEEWKKKTKNLMESLETSEYFISLKYIIQKYLDKTLNIDYINGMIHITLIDNNERIVYFDELSSGEKSLLTIIFWLYGNDLKEGFIIINEPELHLHPQIQKELAQTFENISENISTQLILPTNSSLFINESNITNVYRVYKDKNWWSNIISPKINVDYDDATLIHMLKFENLSKIFFVNKIILVEWDTDAYFFSFYLNYLKTLPNWKGKIRDYEIININGKGSLHTWIRFLNKFNIQNYFIGDRDNTVDYWFFSKAELNKFYQLANKSFREPNKSKKYNDYYNRLVKTILTFSPKKYKAIIKGIEKLYEENIFILKEWAIETYVSVEKKWLGQIANFCNSYFQDRLLNPQFQSQRKELEEIMQHIFPKSE